MSTLIFCAVILSGFVFTYRKAYVALADDVIREFPSLPFTSNDRAECAGLAFVIALLWPVTLIGYVLYRFATPYSPQEQRRELDERERRVERMERELGINR